MPACRASAEPRSAVATSLAASAVPSESCLLRWHPFTLAGLGKIRLRPATAADNPWMEALYLESMKRHLGELGAFDVERTRRHFRLVHQIQDARIIETGKRPLGWLEVGGSTGGLILRQIHLVEQARNRGLGSTLLRQLARAAKERGLPVRLYVVRTNPARLLYRRFGFKVVGNDGTRLRMILTPGTRPVAAR